MLKLSENERDFGEIPANLIYPFQLTVTNHSDVDVTPSVSASCGCTTPTLDPKTIPAGGTATLSGLFDPTGKKGLQTKRVYVIYTINAITQSEIFKFHAKIAETEIGE